MTDQQVVALDAQGFELFSHGFSHAPLSTLSEADIQEELQASKQGLEEMVGHNVVGIGYPHGAYDDRVTRLAKEAGYQRGLTIEPGFADDAVDELKIGRTSVSARDSLVLFRLKACGAYRAAFYLQRFKRLLLGPRAARRSPPLARSLRDDILARARRREHHDGREDEGTASLRDRRELEHATDAGGVPPFRICTDAVPPHGGDRDRQRLDGRLGRDGQESVSTGPAHPERR
jgi:hypothetical protein